MFAKLTVAPLLLLVLNTVGAQCRNNSGVAIHNVLPTSGVHSHLIRREQHSAALSSDVDHDGEALPSKSGLDSEDKKDVEIPYNGFGSSHEQSHASRRKKAGHSTVLRKSYTAIMPTLASSPSANDTKLAKQPLRGHRHSGSANMTVVESATAEEQAKSARIKLPRKRMFAASAHAEKKTIKRAGAKQKVVVSRKYNNVATSTNRHQDAEMKAPAPCISDDRATFISFLVRNMSFAELAKHVTIHKTFEDKSAELIAFSASHGQSVLPRDVSIKLSGGSFSVMVEATVNSPSHVCADGIQASLALRYRNFASLMELFLNDQANIGTNAACLGTINVGIVSLPKVIGGLGASQAPKSQEDFEKELSLGHGEGGTVYCGAHWAEDCSACPRGEGRRWCNGDCAWEDNSSECLFRSELIWCGSHAANACADCVWTGTTYRGENWCNGECYWLNGECYAKYPGAPPMPRRAKPPLQSSERSPTSNSKTAANTIDTMVSTTAEPLVTLPSVYRTHRSSDLS